MSNRQTSDNRAERRSRGACSSDIATTHDGDVRSTKSRHAPVDGRFREIAKNLGATMTVVDGAHHMSILASVAPKR
ncbi:MAG: hypothetical protein ACO1OB_34545 [Archangium sp.]